MKYWIHLLILVLITLVILDSANAKPKPIKIDPGSIFSAQANDGRPLTCAPIQGNYIAGSVKKRNRFTPASYELDELDNKIRKLTRKKKFKKEKLDSLQGARTALQSRIEVDNSSCNKVKNPDSDSGPPSSDAVSLAPLSRVISEEEAHTFFERVGFGLSTREEVFKSIGMNVGSSELVDEFMKTRSEDPGLWDLIVDLCDGELNAVETHTPRGQRSAFFELWARSNNPYDEKLAIFLLSVWTVAGDVISDETFRFAFWDYFNKLRVAAYAETELPTLAVQLTRDPLMLIYLNNELNVKGKPNENYARELMELFTLGTANLDGQANYTESNLSGGGDIAMAAKMLTGWKVRRNYLIPALESQYDVNRHENGPHVMFAGTPWQFSGENDENLVRGIFAYHPSVKTYYAKEILKYYLTPEPPRELIERLGTLLKDNKYKLRPTLNTLFKSKAFFHPNYKDTLPKDGIEYVVGIVRHLKLDQAYDRNELDRLYMSEVMPLNLSPSVFWFNPSSWAGSSMAVEKANLLAQLFSDTTAQSLNSPQWTAQTLLPSGSKTADEMIAYVAHRLGIFKIGQNAQAQLVNYLNTEQQWNNTMISKTYDNTDLQAQRRKGLGLYYLLISMPEYQLK